MRLRYLRDERGVAMLLELVLVAAVLALAGLAVYQANHHSTGVAAVQSQPSTANSTEGLAQSAATIVESDATADTATSTGADAMADELSATADDVTTLGDTSNASF